MHVVALVHKDEDTAYGISFPDFPGCISAGSTIEEAIASGTEALIFHLASMIDDGERIPTPRSVDDLRGDAEFADDFEGAILASVSVPLPTEKAHVDLLLDPDLLNKIDRAAQDFPGGRSGFLAEAAREKMARVGQG